MEKRVVVTIGREYGSGGHEIGMKLAKELGVRCYDKELLKLASKESGICEELFSNHDEKPTNSLLYSLVMDTYSLGYSSPTFVDMPINHKVFLALFDAIKHLAEKENCVIVGRCADYILRDCPDLVSVFVHANSDFRAARVAEEYRVSESKARDMLVKTDKKRASYYNFQSEKKWGMASSYNLSVESSALGIEGSVELIADYIRYRGLA